MLGIPKMHPCLRPLPALQASWDSRVGNGAWKISPVTSPPRDRVELVPTPTPTEFRISLADPQSCLRAQGQPQR